jgi:hypothetical protein
MKNLLVKGAFIVEINDELASTIESQAKEDIETLKNKIANGECKIKKVMILEDLSLGY